MRKRIGAALLSMALAASLTACGNSGGAPEVTSEGGQTTASMGEQTTAASAGNGDTTNTKLRIMSMQQPENPEGPIEREIADAFMEKYPGVEIEWIGVAANDMSKKLSAMAAGNDLPDIITAPTEMVSAAYDMGILMDLKQILPTEFLDDFYPEVLAQTTVNDQLLILPYQGMNAALLYRLDWFEEEGLDAPENWEDFSQAAKTLTKDTDGDGKADRWGFAMMATRNASAESRFLYITRSFGVKELWQDTDGTWKTDVGNEAFKKALGMFCDFALVDKVVAPGVLETGYGEAANLVVAGKSGMLITGSNAVGTIISQNPDLQGKLASCPIPMGTEHVSDPREVGYSISSSCQNVELAKEYLMFVCQKENLAKWTEGAGRVPTMKSAQDLPQLQSPEMEGFVAGSQYFYERPKHSGYVEVQDVIGEAYQSVLSGNATVDEAASTAQEKVEEIIESYE